MRENQLPVHCTSAEETGRVRPAVDSSDGGVHIPRERVTHVEARPAGNYLADDLSNSVHITLAKRVIKPDSDKANCLAAQTPIPMSDDEISSGSNLGLKLADGTKAALSQRYTKLEEARDSKLGIWLLASAVISVTTLYLGGTAVTDTATAGAGTVAGAAGIHGAPTGRNSASAVQPKDETAIYGETRNSVVCGVRPAAPASSRDADRSAAQHYGSSSGAHRTLASDRDETGTRENSLRPTHNGDDTARSNAGDSGSGGGMLPAPSPQSKPITNNPMDFMNQGFNQEFTFPATEMPKAAEAKTSKSKKDFMVPPPPPTPCVLPPAFGFFLMQQAQQHAAPQQQLQQAQAQASPKTHNQAAARENTQQPTAASGRTEATQSAALDAADQELQAALSSSLRTVGEWRR
jgi:hypothetical protein